MFGGAFFDGLRVDFGDNFGVFQGGFWGILRLIESCFWGGFRVIFWAVSGGFWGCFRADFGVFLAHFWGNFSAVSGLFSGCFWADLGLVRIDLGLIWGLFLGHFQDIL